MMMMKIPPGGIERPTGTAARILPRVEQKLQRLFDIWRAWVVHLSPLAGRGRLHPDRRLAPSEHRLRSRVRGFCDKPDACSTSPSSQPSPRKRGEGARRGDSPTYFPPRFFSITSQICAATSGPPSEAIARMPVGEVTLISVS